MSRVDKKIDEEDIRKFVKGETTIKELSKKYGIQPLAMSKRITKSVDDIENEQLKTALKMKIEENLKRSRKSIHISQEDIKAYERKEVSIKQLAEKYQCNRNTMSSIMSKIFPEAPKEKKAVAPKNNEGAKEAHPTKRGKVILPKGYLDEYVGTDMFSWINASDYSRIDPQYKEDFQYKVCILAMTGKSDVEIAMKTLGIKDRETFKDICLDYICQVENKDLAREYLSNIERVRNDYSKINFVSVAERMLRGNLSQSEIAEQLSIAPRIVSREFEKLKALDDDNEPKKLYTVVKQYAEVKMRRQELSEMAVKRLEEYLDGYRERHPDFFKAPDMSRTEQILEEKKKKIDQATALLKEGKSRKEVAEELGISVSSVRRILVKDSKKAKIMNGEYDKIAQIVNNPYAFNDDEEPSL